MRSGDALPLTRVRAFTVGLAAASSDFDDQAFIELLVHSLKSSAQNNDFKVTREGDPQQEAKIRGMLVQQYLAAEEVPITISNLSYKLQSVDNEFKIGERVVPRSLVDVSRAGTGQVVRATLKEDISAVMNRDSRGRYTVSYEELGGGGGGNITIPVRDVEIMDTESGNQSARQGDISFNWKVNLETVAVYRIENFNVFDEEVGLFVAN